MVHSACASSIHRAPQARYCHSTATIPFPSTSACKRELVIMWGGTLSDDDSVADVCAICGSPASSRCARCKEARYCSRACQREDWPCHKHICGQQQAQLHHLCDEARDMFCANSLKCFLSTKAAVCLLWQGSVRFGFSRRSSSCTLEEQAELLIAMVVALPGCAQTNLSMHIVADIANIIIGFSSIDICAQQGHHMRLRSARSSKENWTVSIL